MPAPKAPEKNPGHAPAADPQSLKDLWHYNLNPGAVTPEGLRKIAALRSAATAMADAIIDLVPPGRDQALALSKNEEMSFHANAGIARGNPLQDTPDEDKKLESKEGESK